MASVSGIHALTSGLGQHLSRVYQLQPITDVSCKFEPLGITDLKKLDGQDTKVTILMLRIVHNEHLRNRPRDQLPAGRSRPLTVDVQLLLTVWADSALKEQALLAWTLREMHQRPLLDRAVLGDSAGFGAAEQVAMTPQDLSLDDLSKLWQVLVPPMRPSLGYLARNVPIDLDTAPEAEPVLATRFSLQDPPEVPA